MSERQPIITIDGPAGVGKSTVSRRIAAVTGFLYLDTGAMYRAVGLFLERNRIDLSDEEALPRVLAQLQLELLPPGDLVDGDVGVRLNGEDVSAALRTPEMAMVASKVSALAPVRAMLTARQRQYGQKGGIVAEGRDTGTVVFPQAEYKFFLDATAEIRAARRVEQLHRSGKQADYEEILKMTVVRDRNDRERTLAPLRPADDACCIDTGGVSLQEVVGKILTVVEGRLFRGEK